MLLLLLLDIIKMQEPLFKLSYRRPDLTDALVLYSFECHMDFKRQHGHESLERN